MKKTKTKTKIKKKTKALAKKAAGFGARAMAVGKHYEEHAREINAFAKKIKSEWNSVGRNKR